MLQLLATLKQGIKKRYHRQFGPFRDVVVISYPKSGRTWLRVMLNDFNILPTYEHDGSQNSLNIPYWNLPEDKAEYSNNRIIFLARDPRDTVVSSYFQVTKRHQVYNGSISEFIRDDRYGIKKILKFHSIWDQNRHIPSDFKLIKYEDLHVAPFNVMKELLGFLKVHDIDEEKLRNIIWFYRFNNMHKLEKQGYFKRTFKNILYPKDPNDQDTYKTRKGKVGGFDEYFTREDIEYCNQVMKEFPNPFYRDAL
ncbi:MAG: sulfotransferase domain-containing protein [Bacteroidota bacterium]